MSSVGVIILFCVIALLIVAAVVFGVRYIFAKQKRFLNAMSAGYAEGTPHPTTPRLHAVRAATPQRRPRRWRSTCYKHSARSRPGLHRWNL